MQQSFYLFIFLVKNSPQLKLTQKHIMFYNHDLVYLLTDEEWLSLWIYLHPQQYSGINLVKTFF